MKKLFFGLIIITTYFLFAQGNLVYAAVAIPGYITDCLNGTQNGHTETLTFQSNYVRAPQSNATTWIFACITSDQLGTKCTTGNPNLDDSLFGKHDDYTALQGYKGTTVNVGGVDGGGNPRTTNDVAFGQSGFGFTQEPTTWSDAYVPAVIHQWSWIQADTAVATGDTQAGNLNTPKQGTLDFTRVVDNTKSCAKVFWDPRGYVFDATTLYPVKNVSVTLSSGPHGGAFVDVPNGIGITNPTLSSGSNGQYSFYVEPGYYKLRLTSSNATITQLAEVNSEYQALFSDKDGKANVYKEGDEVQEVRGSVAIAHIPVHVTDTSLLLTNLVTMEKGSESVGGQLNIFGRVSHPKSKLILTMTLLSSDGTSVDVVKTDSTDELGVYDKYIDQMQVDPASGRTLILGNLNVEPVLNSFYTTGVFSKSNFFEKTVTFARNIFHYLQSKIAVNAAVSTSYNVQPIPLYIEGIAYDANGSVIPKAIVGVYQFFSDKPMYVTVADATGHYKIGSQHLPQTQYTLRYRKPTGEVITVDTGTFIKQNVKYFAENNIKPFSIATTSPAEDNAAKTLVEQAVTNNDVTALLSVGSKSATNTVGKNLVPQSTGQMVPVPGSSTSGMQGIIMIVVVILVLVIIGVGAFVMMKSKQAQMPPPQF